jgi:hypothetical protein
MLLYKYLAIPYLSYCFEQKKSKKRDLGYSQMHLLSDPNYYRLTNLDLFIIIYCFFFCLTYSYFINIINANASYLTLL